MHFSTLVDIIILTLFLGMAILVVGMLAYTRKLVQENDTLLMYLEDLRSNHEYGSGRF